VKGFVILLNWLGRKEAEILGENLAVRIKG
jgi:hypothetical protein